MLTQAPDSNGTKCRARARIWGSVAAGAVFKTMRYGGGRRRPHAAERSRPLLKQNAPQLSEAEILVRLFNDAIEQGQGENSPVLRQRLAQRWSPPGEPRRAFTAANIAAVFAAWKNMLRQWTRLPVGGALELAWGKGSRRKPSS
jgi:hypothetical protein